LQKKLTPIEKYAMVFLEAIQEPFQTEQLKQAEVSETFKQTVLNCNYQFKHFIKPFFFFAGGNRSSKERVGA
jgi:hypothetical protein